MTAKSKGKSLTAAQKALIAKVASKATPERKQQFTFETTRTRTLEDGTVVVEVKCGDCGKWLRKDTSVVQGEGHYCQTLRDMGHTPKTLAAHRNSMTQATPPDGYIKLASLDRTVKAAHAKGHAATISKMVKAIGGDRCLDPSKAAHPIAVPVYVGKARWVDGWLATEDGLQAIATGDFSKAPTK